MFRILVKYVGRETQVYVTRQFSSISEIKNLFLGSQNPSFKGVDGPVTIDPEGIVSVLIQRLSPDGTKILEKSELKLMEGQTMDDAQINEVLPGEVSLEKTEDDSMSYGVPATQLSDSSEPSSQTFVVPVDNEPFQKIENIEEVPSVNTTTSEVTSSETVFYDSVKEDTPKMGDENKLTQSFQSFREKYLDRETQETSWEDTIIAKKDQRIAKLKEIADALDMSNENLEAFKKEALGL